MKIIAHRGASAECPENTLAAFDRAIAIGVDAIETDVLATRDGHLVARHDDLIRAPSGWRYVRELTLAELQTIDLGRGERIPTLEQVADRVGGRCPLVLDVKADGIGDRLAAFIRQRRLESTVHVTSFLQAELAAIGRLLPSVARSLIFTALPSTFDALCREAGVRHVSLSRGYLDEATVRRATGQGLRVWAYTVNTPREAATFASWGVDAIFTDDPAAMQSLRDHQ